MEEIMMKTRREMIGGGAGPKNPLFLLRFTNLNCNAVDCLLQCSNCSFYTLESLETELKVKPSPILDATSGNTLIERYHPVFRHRAVGCLFCRTVPQPFLQVPVCWWVGRQRASQKGADSDVRLRLGTFSTVILKQVYEAPFAFGCYHACKAFPLNIMPWHHAFCLLWKSPKSCPSSLF